MKKLGIDVSDNQGYIDWSKVKNAGVEFAILRSTRGSGNPDKQLASNIAGCKSNGIPFDFYKYRYSTTEKAGREEARNVIEVLFSLGIVPSKDVVIWDDVEDKSLMALGKNKVLALAEVFREEVEKAGFGYGLYMGKYAYENQFYADKFIDDLWIARYYNGYNPMNFGTMPNEKYIPTAKAGKLWGWQFTSSGRVDGINGNVDMNIAYYDIKDTEVKPEYYETPEFTLVDSLNKIGVDSSFKNRKRIAEANGIGTPYTGNAFDNLEMLRLLNDGKLLKI